MNKIGTSSFELAYIIVNDGMASKVLHKAKKYGIPGGTIFRGKGTVNNRLMNFLSLYDQKKEIIVMCAESILIEDVLKKLNKEFQFSKPNHGIIFTVKTCEIIGSKSCSCKNIGRGVEENMYQVIFTIVNRGIGEDVIDAAKLAGSKGGTIVNARGSGIHETMKLFNMEIEPEKEMVIIISKKEIANEIVDSIRKEVNIDKPGNGIIFVQDVGKVYGIYE